MSRKHFGCGCSRREFLARGLYGIGLSSAMPIFLSRTSAALDRAGAAGHERRETSQPHPRWSWSCRAATTG